MPRRNDDALDPRTCLRCGLLGPHLSFLEPSPFHPERLPRLVYDSRVGLATKKLSFDVDIF
jgi:hypothetical protein